MLNYVSLLCIHTCVMTIKSNPISSKIATLSYLQRQLHQYLYLGELTASANPTIKNLAMKTKNVSVYFNVEDEGLIELTELGLHKLMFLFSVTQNSLHFTSNLTQNRGRIW